MRRAATAFTILIALGSGCGDDSVMDAGTDADTATPPPPDSGPVETVPDPPATPALPDSACPEGWTTLDVAGTTACEPWPLETGPGCADGEARFPGDAACAPLGPACPPDGVPTDLPEGPVLHVRAGSTMGDGTLAAPFGAINDALGSAVAGDVIAVHMGTYPEALDLTMTGGISVIGACAAETILEAPAGPSNSAAVLMTGDTHLERIFVRADRPGVRAEGAGTATIRDVYVEARQWGVIITDMGTLVAESVVVRDTDPGGDFGYGLFMNLASTFELRRGVFEGHRGFGLAVDGEGSSVLVEDSVIRSITEVADGSLGNGLALQRSNTATLRRVLVEHVSASGLYVQNGSELTIEDVVVRDVTAMTDGEAGFGLAMNSRASVDVSRMRIERATNSAIVGVGFGTSFRARDLVLHEVAANPILGRGGAGAFVDTGVMADVERMLIHRAIGAGVSLTGVDLDATFRDTTFVDIRTDLEYGITGTGIDVRMGAHGTFERVFVRDAIGAGVVSSDPGSLLVASDLLVVDSVPGPSGFGGRGASIQVGGSLDCTRCEFRDCIETGVLLHGEMGSSLLRDVVVEGTSMNELNGAAMGIVAVAGAVGDVERFVVQGNDVAGLQIADGGDLLIRDGVIAGHPIGVNVQDAPANPANLTDRVIYRDNDRNLDSSGLPVPQAGPI